jgi:hypothetical protein
MNVFERTPEQADALYRIQRSFTPEVLEYLDELAAMMKATPEYDIDRECNNIGYLLREILQKETPQLSEPMAYGLPFAFIEMLKTRLKAN